MTGEDRKNYRSIVSRRWKEIQEDPAMLSVYDDRARQMQNEDSQNEKMLTAKHHKKVPKHPEFVDTDSDDEQEPTAKQPQKASKASEFVDKDTNDEQGSAVKCIVIYSTEDEQEPIVKQLQKA